MKTGLLNQKYIPIVVSQFNYRTMHHSDIVYKSCQLNVSKFRPPTPSVYMLQQLPRCRTYIMVSAYYISIQSSNCSTRSNSSIISSSTLSLLLNHPEQLICNLGSNLTVYIRSLLKHYHHYGEVLVLQSTSDGRSCHQLQFDLSCGQFGQGAMLECYAGSWSSCVIDAREKGWV